MAGEIQHLDENPEDHIGDELPDPWDQPGLWDEPTQKVQDLSALISDPKQVS